MSYCDSPIFKNIPTGGIISVNYPEDLRRLYTSYGEVRVPLAESLFKHYIEGAGGRDVEFLRAHVKRSTVDLEINFNATEESMDAIEEKMLSEFGSSLGYKFSFFVSDEPFRPAQKKGALRSVYEKLARFL